MRTRLIIPVFVVAITIATLGYIYWPRPQATSIPTLAPIPAAVVQFCGFSGLPQPQISTVTNNGRTYPVETWETWAIVPAEDDNPTDGIDAAQCERHFELTIAEPNGELLIVIISVKGGPFGITAARGDEILDDFATNDLLWEIDEVWIYDLDQIDETFVERFWITESRGAVVPR